MQDIIINILNNFGYLGFFLLIAIENIFPPIPSEAILLFGGFMSTYTNLNTTIMIIISTISSTLGAIILYNIGKLFNEERIKKIISSNFGKALRLKENDINKSKKWFDTKGQKSIFFCRFIPLVRSLISIPAGMNKMNIIKFLIYTFLGSLIWNTSLIILGSIVGDNWYIIANTINKYSKCILIIIIVLITIKLILENRKIIKNKFYKK